MGIMTRPKAISARQFSRGFLPLPRSSSAGKWCRLRHPASWTVRCSAFPPIQSLGSASRLDRVGERPLFTVGLFADAQYKDADDYERLSEPGRVKYFRIAKDRLEAAVEDFCRHASSISCIVNLVSATACMPQREVWQYVTRPTKREKHPGRCLQGLSPFWS